ncbi:DsbA family protein [Arcobacter sp.]|uniref:DsbA family protein n=1 Tax=Arcobacter sp. TaxID=1872629 RepID=UPI003C71D73B
MNYKKLICIFSIMTISLSAANFDNDVISFEKKRLSNNARVEIKDIQISMKKQMPEPMTNWYGFIIQIKAKVKDKEINAKDIIFSNGEIVAPELINLKTGASYKDLLQPKLDASYYQEDHLIAGNAKAKDKIVVFSDPLCPFCIEILPGLIEHVKDNKDEIALYYYNFPLLRVHPASATIVKAIDVAKQMGIKDVEKKVYTTNWEKYFPVDSKDEDKILSAFNKEFKTNITKEQINSTEVMARVLDDVKMGDDVMVKGTPTIFVNGEKDDSKLKYETLGSK